MTALPYDVVDYATVYDPHDHVKNMIDWLKHNSDNWATFRDSKNNAESEDRDARNVSESVARKLVEHGLGVTSAFIESLLAPKAKLEAVGNIKPGRSTYTAVEEDPATYQRFLQESVYSSKFETAIANCGGQYESIDEAMSFPPGMSKKLLRWNPGPQKSFITHHPTSAVTLNLSHYRDIEDLVKREQSNRDIVQAFTDGGFLISEEMVQTMWNSLHPHVRLNFVASFFQDSQDLLRKTLQEPFYKSQQSWIDVEKQVL